MRKLGKIVIIGIGFVGVLIVFVFVDVGFVIEFVLIDVNCVKVEGEVMDLNYGIFFVKFVKIWVGDYEDCKDVDIIIIIVGVN